MLQARRRFDPAKAYGIVFLFGMDSSTNERTPIVQHAQWANILWRKHPGRVRLQPDDVDSGAEESASAELRSANARESKLVGNVS